jgi:D-3-phosphoglycerate dehydrogenase
VRVVAIDDGYADYRCEQELLGAAGASFEVLACGGDAAAVLDRIRDAAALMVRESRIGAEVIAALPALRGIVRYGIGVDNIDLAAAARHGVRVANVPDYGTEEVSDQGMALLLAVVRRVAARDAAVRAGAWNVARQERMYRIAGKTLGLLGYGRIARAMERKMRGFGVERVLVYDPFVTQLPPGVEQMGVEDVCRHADFISVHAPLTRETHHLLDAARIGLMKPEAIVVNTARGALIDEAALVRALQEGRLFGAGLDVFEQEPLPAASPLRKLANVVLSDHTGWYSEESVRDLQQGAAADVARILRGEAPKHWVNRDRFTEQEGTVQ